jgi:hypothetical protein
VKYLVRFERVPMEINVTIDAPDEDTATDAAWDRANEYLQTIYGDSRGVTVTASLDGIGADTVVEHSA